MASLGGFFTAAAAPLAKKVLQGLGIGMVSYVGVELVFSQLRDLVTSSWSGLPLDIVSILSLAGWGQGLGIVLAAMAARVAMLSLSFLGKV